MSQLPMNVNSGMLAQAAGGGINPQLAAKQTAATPQTGGGFNWGSFLPNLATGIGGGALVNMAYNKLEDIGQAAAEGATALGEQAKEDTAFKGYSVTTGTGSGMTTNADGSTTLNLSPNEQAFYKQMFGGAGNMFQNAMQDTAGREQDIYERIRAAQRPEEQRAQSALEERLAAQGRLGVRTNQYGGTPEQLAMSKAQAEAQNSAMLGAMQQAQQEQAQQANIGQQMLGAAYLPQAQMLNALQPGMQMAGMQQKGQLYGAGLFQDAGMGGLEALLGAGLGQANLAGQLGTALLGGMFSGNTPQSSIPEWLKQYYSQQAPTI